MPTQVMKVCQDVTFKGTETKNIKRGGDVWGSYEKPVSVDDTVCAETVITSKDAASEAIAAKAALDKKLSGCDLHYSINDCTYNTRGLAGYTIETRTSLLEDLGSVLKKLALAMSKAGANTRMKY